MIRHLGAVHWAPGDFVGVELTSPYTNGHEGTIGAVNYFTTARPKHGIFVRPSDVDAFEAPPPGSEAVPILSMSPYGSNERVSGSPGSVAALLGHAGDKFKPRGSMFSRSVATQKRAALSSASMVGGGSTAGAKKVRGLSAGRSLSHGVSTVPLEIHAAQVARYEAEIAQLRARLRTAVTSNSPTSSLASAVKPVSTARSLSVDAQPLPDAAPVRDSVDDIDPALLVIEARSSLDSSDSPDAAAIELPREVTVPETSSLNAATIAAVQNELSLSDLGLDAPSRSAAAAAAAIALPQPSNASARASFTYWGSRRGGARAPSSSATRQDAVLPPPQPPAPAPAPAHSSRGKATPAPAAKKVLVSRPHPRDIATAATNARAAALAGAASGMRSFVGVRSTGSVHKPMKAVASPQPPPAPPRTNSTANRPMVSPKSMGTSLPSPSRAAELTPALPQAAALRLLHRQPSVALSPTSSTSAAGPTSLPSSASFHITPINSATGGVLQSPGFALPPRLALAGAQPSIDSAAQTLTPLITASPPLPASPLRPENGNSLLDRRSPQRDLRRIASPPSLPPAPPLRAPNAGGIFGSRLFAQMQKRKVDGSGSASIASNPSIVIASGDDSAALAEAKNSQETAAITAPEAEEAVSADAVVERLRSHFIMLRAEAAKLELEHIEAAQLAASSPAKVDDATHDSVQAAPGEESSQTHVALPVAAPGPPVRRVPPPIPAPPLALSPGQGQFSPAVLPAAPQLQSEHAIATLSPAATMEPEVMKVIETRAFIRAYAGVCERGWQPTDPDKLCQDAVVMLEHPPCDGVLLGVFDGHGSDGAAISSHLRDEVSRHLFQSPKLEQWVMVSDNIPAPMSAAELAEVEQLLRSDAAGCGAPPPSSRQTVRAVCGEPRLRRDVAGALKDALKAAEASLISRQDIDCSLAGSTACLAFVCDGDHLTIANVGDSRAMLLRQRRDDATLLPIGVTIDHKPTLPGETRRIMLAGGRVKALSYPDGTEGPYRVWLGKEDSPGLAMSRSIGDVIGKRAGVSSSPDIYTATLLPTDDAFLVIASDGLWDFMSAAEVSKVVSQAGVIAANAATALLNGETNPDDPPPPQHLQLAVEALADEANARWVANDDCIDDISIIIAEIGAQMPAIEHV